MPVRTYFDAFDHRAALRDYPIGGAFLETFRRMGRDELRARQEERFRRVLARAWGIPFYRRLWGGKGIEPGDVRSLGDIGRLPAYTKSDLMRSIADHPPLGDFHGWEPGRPAVLHTTSGTTGRPQVLLYGPTSRELQNLLLARIYLLQGLRPEDVVHSVYGFGMVNGGHYIRETILHFTDCLLLPAGTGLETRSVAQVALMRDFGATVLLGFADYIRKLADVAREQGMVPGEDIRLRMISGHIGRESRAALSAAWGGAEVYDWYGVGDTGVIAGEGPDRDGLHVLEDAHHVEILHPDSGAPVADGESGNLVVTTLFKDDVYPIIRFNTQDVSAFHAGTSALGLCLRRIRGFLGRSDNMVKIRGINVYPHAVAALLPERAEATGEYLCRVDRDARGRDDLTVLIEARGDAAADARDAFRALLRARLGIEVAVELVAPGGLAALTEVESRQKAIRLIDNRFRKEAP